MRMHQNAHIWSHGWPSYIQAITKTRSLKQITSELLEESETVVTWLQQGLTAWTPQSPRDYQNDAVNYVITPELITPWMFVFERECFELALRASGSTYVTLLGFVTYFNDILEWRPVSFWRHIVKAGLDWTGLDSNL